MKPILHFAFLILSGSIYSQSVIQSVNSGSIVAANSLVSVGEIVVVPENQSQSSSGLIGILVQTLEVPQLELSQNIKVFPNPTTAAVYFETTANLQNQTVSVYNLSGQLVTEKQISTENTLDLSGLSAGMYLIQFADKTINSFKIIKH